MSVKRIIILGATGSIGMSSFDVIRSLGEEYQIVGASCHSKIDRLLPMAEEFGVSKIAVSGKNTTEPRVQWSGPDAVRRLLKETEADIVVNGIAGSAGLMPSVWAIQSGKDLALANKETIVMTGPLIRALAAKEGRTILPVDSEHSAIFHLLQHQPERQLNKIIITASGGAFRDTPLEEFSRITPADALKHPTWDMGAKITIDSATMANKGLEVIEAHYLFDLPGSRIAVLIHPQSCIHSMIQTVDGSFYAQISSPDMRIPIQNALTFPEVKQSPFGALDFADTSFSFQEPDYKRYPLLPLAYQAAASGGAYPLVYNAANEAAVDAFRKEKIGFTDIAELVERVLQNEWPLKFDSFEQALEIHSIAWNNSQKLMEEHMELQR